MVYVDVGNLAETQDSANGQEMNDSIESEACEVITAELELDDSSKINTRGKTAQIGKVGRPITSVRTLNANFPDINEIIGKLESGECYTRSRSINSSSEVWSIFEEVAYSNSQEFTGIVRCKMCLFMTRYHGQITGTSHMRRHTCFAMMAAASSNETSKGPPSDQTSAKGTKKRKETHQAEGDNGEEHQIDWANVYEKFNPVKDAISSEYVGYLSCKNCKLLVKREPHAIAGHVCKSKDLQKNCVTPIETSILLFRMKPKSRATPIWDDFEEVIDPSSNTVLGYVRCKKCKEIIKASDPKSIPSVLRKHLPLCDYDCSTTCQPVLILPHNYESMMNNSSGVESNAPSIQKIPLEVQTRTINAQTMPSPSTPSTSITSTGIIAPPSTATPKIINAKADFRDKVIQFCYSELVSLETVTSDSFRRLAQSLMSLGSQYGRSTLVLPDVSQLHLQMHEYYSQMKNQIKSNLESEITGNMGGALVCDSQDDLCILSAYYINSDWQLVESILSATTSVDDINSFITLTLNDYGLNEEERLAKFTFVSKGGLFDGVNLCLTSVAHAIDQIIENAIFSDDTFTDLIEKCRYVCTELHIDIKLDPAIQNVNWIYKWELMNNVVLNKDKFELKNSSLNLDLIQSLLELMETFKEAAIELRHCNKYPTLNHVLLWYHKLLKVLNTPSSCASLSSNFHFGPNLINSIKDSLKINLQQSFPLDSLHKIATFLWPKFRYLKMLTPEERDQVHSEVRSYIETRMTTSNDCESSISTDSAKKARSHFLDWEDTSDGETDELEKYINAMLTSCNEENLLQWWKEHQNDFPKLSYLAKWILSVPASVTSLERFKLYSTQRVNDELLFLHCNARKKRFSSIKKSLVRSSWDEKMKLKEQRKAIKTREERSKAIRQQKLEEQRQRREEARKRREENIRKAEIVQPIKNTAKLRRMSKKELKKVRKA